MKRTKKLILTLFIASLLMTLPLMTAQAVKVVHLSSGAHSESWQNFLREMKGPFEEANPGFEIEILTDPRPQEKFLVMNAGGVSPDVLDLVTHVSAPLLYDGMFYDLNKFLDAPTRGLFPPAMLNALTTPAGLLYALPIEVYSIVTWYNLDMLQGAGLIPPAELKATEWNWEKMREYGRKLTKDEDGDGVAEIWGLDRLKARPYIQTVQAGSNFFDRDIFPTQSTFLNEGVVTAVEWIEKLMWEDRVTQPGTVGGGTYFYHSKAAIDVVDGPGILGTYMQGVPFDWDVTLQPYGPVNNATNVSLNGFQISSQSKIPADAWQWVKFISTTEQAQRSMATHTGRLPMLAKVARTWNTCVPDLPDNWMAFFEQSVHPDNVFLKEGMVMDPRIMTALTAQLTRVWRGEASARVALEEAERLVTAYFAEAK